MMHFRPDRARRLARLGLACLIVALPLGALAQATPDPDAMASAPAPEHDPAATHDGRSASDYAEMLAEGTSAQRRTALQQLAGMRVDALPAREVVRALALQGGTMEMSEAQAFELRTGAMYVLMTMQAPEAGDVARTLLLDPESFTQDNAYEMLLTATGEIGVEPETLAHDLRALHETAPDHATRLMLLDSLVGPARGALEEAVFNADHDAAASRHFLANLPALDFLTDDQKVAYLRAHQDVAAEHFNETRDAIVGVGTDAALDIAMELDAARGFEPHQTISRFASGPMSPQRVADHFLAEAQAQLTEQAIRSVLGSLGLAMGTLANDAATPDEASAYLDLIIDTNVTLMNEGPSEIHKAAAIQHQIRHLQVNSQTPLPPTLGPVFDLLDAGGASPAVHNAAATALRQSPGRIAERDPGYFIERSLDLLWASGTPEVAELPVTLLTSLMRSPEFVDPVITRIADEIDAHLDGWQANPAAAVVIHSGSLPQLDHTPARETAGVVMGNVIASPELDLAYLNPFFARGGLGIATLDRNTVEGVIAVFSPTVFGGVALPSEGFSMDSFMGPMLGRPAWLQRDAEAMATWTDFLDRVVALDHPEFSPVAVQALDGLR